MFLYQLGRKSFFFRCVLNKFMMWPEDANLCLSGSSLPLRLVLSSAEADRLGQFCLKGGAAEETGGTRLGPPAEKREKVEQAERPAGR